MQASLPSKKLKLSIELRLMMGWMGVAAESGPTFTHGPWLPSLPSVVHHQGTEAKPCSLQPGEQERCPADSTTHDVKQTRQWHLCYFQASSRQIVHR